MDEPLSNLDAKLRVQMRAEIHQLQRRLGVTTIYVTHDQVEAMTMGDRVAVMNAGRLQQVDTPQVLYDHPVNEFVAGFIGSPSINLVEAQLARDNGSFAVTFGDHRLAVDDPRRRATTPASRTTSGGRSSSASGPRTSRTRASQPDAPADRRLDRRCDLTEPLGAEVLVHFSDLGAPRIVSSATARRRRRREVPFGSGGDEDARQHASRRPRQPEDADRRGQRDRARRRHEPALLLRPGDARGDLAVEVDVRRSRPSPAVRPGARWSRPVQVRVRDDHRPAAARPTPSGLPSCGRR